MEALNAAQHLPHAHTRPSGLRLQLRVVGALMIRDALSRYGHHGLGFFWVVGEPLLLTSSIILLWSTTNMTHGSDVAVVPFALTGYSFITLWRHIVFKSVKAMSNNAALAYHRQVSYIDILVAKALLELVGIFAAFIIAYIPLTFLGFCPVMKDPFNLVIGFTLSAWFAFGFGMTLAGLSELNEAVHHLVNPIMYISLPLTGCFFMVSWLPESTQKIVLWSPLIHGVEMFRSGLFPADVPTTWSAAYLVVCSSGLTFTGLFACHHARSRLEI